MNNKELKILYKLVQDLFFDIDRMSQSGKDTLGKIDNIIQEKLYHVRRDKDEHESQTLWRNSFDSRSF